MNKHHILCIQQYISNLNEALNSIKFNSIQEMNLYYRGRSFKLYSGETHVINSIYYNKHEDEFIVTFNIFDNNGRYFYYGEKTLSDVNLDEYK